MQGPQRGSRGRCHLEAHLDAHLREPPPSGPSLSSPAGTRAVPSEVPPLLLALTDDVTPTAAGGLTQER